MNNATEGFIAGARQSAQEKNEGGYILLFPEPKTFDGADVLFAYYVKKSDFPMFPFGLKEDEDRRVYCFTDVYNRETDKLIPGLAVMLSQKASRSVIEEWFRMMYIKATALDVIDECLKH
jgi:hypothetical protein